MADQLPAVASFASKMVFPHLYHPGWWYGTPGSTVASPSMGDTTLRVLPFVVSVRTRFDQAGMEVTSAGQSGSVMRMGIYADDGGGYPSALLAEFGTVAVDAVANPVVSIALTLNAGLYWLGSAVQNAPTTRPTVRASSNAYQYIGVAASTSTTLGAIAYASASGAVSGALPNPFPVTLIVSGNTPRVVLRAA